MKTKAWPIDVHYLSHSEPSDGHANEDVVIVRPHPGNAGVLLCALADGADEAVCEDDAAGYCSLVSLCVSGQGVWGASCGDSGALLLSGGRDLLLTGDRRKDPPAGSSASGGRLPDDFSVALLYDGGAQMEQNGPQL